MKQVLKVEQRGHAQESPFQKKRRQEVLDFIEAGFQYAEVETSGVALCCEYQHYKKAIKQLGLEDKVRAFQRNYKIMLERKDWKKVE